MKTTVAVLVLCLFPTSAHAFSWRTLTPLCTGTFMVVQFADITTTMYGLGTGAVVEINPVFRFATNHGPLVAGVVKGGAATGVSAILLKTHEQAPRWSAALACAGTVFYGAVAWHNAGQIKQLAR